MAYVPTNPYAFADANSGGPDWGRYCADLRYLFGGDLLDDRSLGTEGALEFREAMQRLGVTDADFHDDVGRMVSTEKPPTWIHHQSRRTWRELQRLQALRRQIGGGGGA